MLFEKSHFPQNSSTESKSKSPISLFIDFDGTICTQDLGDSVFENFGTIQPYNKQFKNGELTIYQYWETVCSKLKLGVTLKDIADFAVEQEIDSYFKRFVEYVRAEGIEPVIVSDGFGAYIRPFLRKYGLDDITLYCNELIEDKDIIRPSFPYADESCQCPSAKCKKAQVALGTPEDGIAIYIGDGLSDFCPAKHSDYIFAKKSLAKYCNANSLPHYTYRTFFDVERQLKQLLSSGKLKQRHRPTILRRDVFKHG
ncbi:MAG: 2-hydroxy-3-keto-5-methylthiopentenyl-1-phosphate phosphatase [Candidatus Kapaibacteriales bacterium]